MREGSAPQRRRGRALRRARRRRRGVRARHCGSSRRARRLPHPDPQRLAGKPDAEGGVFLRRRSADALPQSVAGRARPDSRTRGSRERPRLSQLAAGQRPRRSKRAASAQRQRPGPAESGDGNAARGPGCAGLYREINDRFRKHRGQGPGHRSDQGRRRGGSRSGRRRTARLVRQARSEALDPGLEGPSAGRRPLRSRRQDRVCRRERDDA